jgi:two-component sensor histidine kinase
MRPRCERGTCLRISSTASCQLDKAPSVPGGTIRWRFDPLEDDASLRLFWSESGGPKVVPPQRRGFGSQLLEQVLAADFGGKVSMCYAPDGPHFELSPRLSSLGVEQ